MVDELSGVQFGLKSYLQFQMELALHTCSILKSHNMILDQVALQSVQFPVLIGWFILLHDV